MIVVDCSATIAIVLEEDGWERFETVLLESGRSLMSAVNAHEMAVVLGRRLGVSAIDCSWQFLSRFRIDIVPFDEVQAKVAAAAYDRYGKGIDPRARLNLADCAAYALAKTLDVPLLFKGDDFAATDIGSAA